MSRGRSLEQLCWPVRSTRSLGAAAGSKERYLSLRMVAWEPVTSHRHSISVHSPAVRSSLLLEARTTRRAENNTYPRCESCRPGNCCLPLTASSGSNRPAAQAPHGSKRCPQHEGMQWPSRMGGLVVGKRGTTWGRVAACGKIRDLTWFCRRSSGTDLTGVGAAVKSREQQRHLPQPPTLPPKLPDEKKRKEKGP